MVFFIFATDTTDYSDADGGAFFGYIGVACALVFASSFPYISFLNKLTNFNRSWSFLWNCKEWSRN